ncbi:hypothetical protein PIB30_034603 [Stylosanthes scabra]|uniref:Uncharacterized protein n=1 Tax=Stylosanthes scabra TaxID=79078 RepID=A0ABU6VE49_9FABA|nr:hypothetical protein [Stylosanthes scabra]
MKSVLKAAFGCETGIQRLILTVVGARSCSCPWFVSAVRGSCSRRSTFGFPLLSTSPVRVLCKLASTVAPPAFCCPSRFSAIRPSLQFAALKLLVISCCINWISWNWEYDHADGCDA